MALELLLTVAPCLTYAPYTGGSSSLFPAYLYNTWLITPPRQYQESLQPARHFFYEPNGDHLVLLGMELYLLYPGWRMVRYVWNAENGSLVSDLSGPLTSAPYWISWNYSAETGGFGKVYACGNSYTYVQEVDWRTLAPVPGGFKTCDWPDHPIFRHAVVNRTHQVLAGVGSWFLEVWDYQTPVKLGELRLPYLLSDLAYENDDLLWAVHQNGLLSKIDYRQRRFETLTRIKAPDPEDLNYLAAFDSRRKRLVIFRHKPDAADGACRCQLEFYRPHPRPVLLTDPVPIAPLRVSQETPFISQVMGDGGEAVTNVLATGTLLDPVHGQLTASGASTGLDGAAMLRYQAPDDPATDTLQVTVTVPDE